MFLVFFFSTSFTSTKWHHYIFALKYLGSHFNEDIDYTTQAKLWPWLVVVLLLVCLLAFGVCVRGICHTKWVFWFKDKSSQPVWCSMAATAAVHHGLLLGIIIVYYWSTITTSMTTYLITTKQNKLPLVFWPLLLVLLFFSSNTLWNKCQFFWVSFLFACQTIHMANRRLMQE